MHMRTHTHTKETRTLQPQLPILPSLITHSHSNIHTHTHTHTECHTQAPFPHTCALPNSAIPHQHITNMCTHTCMPIKQQQSRCCNSKTLTSCITYQMSTLDFCFHHGQKPMIAQQSSHEPSINQCQVRCDLVCPLTATPHTVPLFLLSSLTVGCLFHRCCFQCSGAGLSK